MGFRQKVFVFGAFLILPLVYFMYSRDVSTMYSRDVSIMALHHNSGGAIPMVPNAKPIMRYPRFAISLSRNCSGKFCLEFLTKDDRRAFKGCLSYTEIHEEVGSCEFINQTLRLPVALASYQGSGNTWVRGLLERATGICTGSVFCDRSLRTHGFIGENIRSGAALVTKTHYPAIVEGVIRVSKVATEHDSGDPETLSPPRTVSAGLRVFEVKTIKKNVKVYRIVNDNEGSKGDPETLYSTEGIMDDPETLYQPSSDFNPLWG